MPRHIATHRCDPRLLGLALALLCPACTKPSATETVVYANALDSADAVLSRTGTSLDSGVSSDGHGSLRIDAHEPTTVRLAEVPLAQAEDAVLFYRAKLRSENISGQAYLEMWCTIPGRGEFFSRALHAPLSGSTEWVSQETPFLLEKGQRAVLAKLNVVVNGTGVLWIDDLRLAMAKR